MPIQRTNTNRDTGQIAIENGEFKLSELSLSWDTSKSISSQFIILGYFTTFSGGQAVSAYNYTNWYDPYLIPLSESGTDLVTFNDATGTIFLNKDVNLGTFTVGSTSLTRPKFAGLTKVRIIRATDINSKARTYAAGTRITSEGLNNSFDQVFNSVAELEERLVQVEGSSFEDTLSLTDLSDIPTVELADRILKYNGTTFEWIPTPSGTSGVSGGDITGVYLTGGNGITIGSEANTTSGDYSATISADIKTNGGLVIESNKLAVDLAGSSITNTLGVSNGGTGATTTSAARTALGVAIGSNVQAYDADLLALAGLTSAANKGIQFTGSGTAATYDLTTAGKALLDDADAAAQRTTLGLGTAALVDTGTGASNAILGNDARLTDARTPADHSAAKITSGTLPVARGGTGVTALPMIAVVTAADAAAARTVLGVRPGTEVQAYDADLAAIAGLTSAADKGIQFTGSGAAAVYTLTAAGKALLDDADAAAQRTTLGVTNVGSYTGQIETASDKTYTIDPGAATARTITGFYIKSASGTVTATLKVGTDVVKAASVSSSSGDQSSLANTGVAVNEVITIVTSSNSSATDVIFAVEYTE